MANPWKAVVSLLPLTLYHIQLPQNDSKKFQKFAKIARAMGGAMGTHGSHELTSMLS